MVAPFLGFHSSRCKAVSGMYWMAVLVTQPLIAILLMTMLIGCGESLEHLASDAGGPRADTLIDDYCSDHAPAEASEILLARGRRARCKLRKESVAALPPEAIDWVQILK